MSFLRWAGSKRQLCETLSHCWRAAQTAGGSGRYIEGFTGSGSLFFHLEPENALLVDINERLIECFERVRDAPRKIASLLNGMSNSEISYYCVRGIEDHELTANERAARFIYLNRFCFNGLYRTNSAGAFNVPYGGQRSGSLANLSSLESAALVLKNATLATGDFFNTIRAEVRKGDFVYLDPPYARENANLGNQYGPENFGTNDLKRLFELAEVIAARNGYFVISYANCPEINAFARKWTAHHVSVRRTIAANVSFRRAANEILITNL